MTPDNAESLIERLGLLPHPEGGYYRETYRHVPEDGGRGTSTAIYFLLTQERASHWHRIDGTEIWHFYGGAPLILSTASSGGEVTERLLGLGLSEGEQPQLVLEPHQWQAARTTGAYTLVGCTVSPAFEFETFELAPPGWAPRPSA